MILGIKCGTRQCLRIWPFSTQSSISTVPLLARLGKRRSHPHQSQRPVPGREPRYLPRPPNQNQLRVRMMTVQRGPGAGPGSIQRIRLLPRWVEALLFLSYRSSPRYIVPFRPSFLVAFLLASTETLESTLRTLIQFPSPAVPCRHPSQIVLTINSQPCSSSVKTPRERLTPRV